MNYIQYGNQPNIVNVGAQAGGNIAIETEITRETRGQIPIVCVRASILPGGVNDPERIFEEAMRDSYAAALQNAALQASDEDTVQLQVHHDGITANGGWWGSQNLPIGNALPDFVESWNNAMQSGDYVDLSQGALEILFTFTFYGRGPPAAGLQRMGAKHVRDRDFDRYHQAQKKIYSKSIFSDMYTHNRSLRKVCFFFNTPLRVPSSSLY